MDDRTIKVLRSLEAQCARREYCLSDIRRKALTRLENDTAAADEVCGSLVADGFVDDRRYAAAFAREKSSLTGWGPVKIRYALTAKGIMRDDIAAALEEIDDAGASARLATLLQARLRSLEGDPQRKLKLLKFALSRGYEYDSVRHEVDRICTADRGPATDKQ